MGILKSLTTLGVGSFPAFGFIFPIPYFPDFPVTHSQSRSIEIFSINDSPYYFIIVNSKYRSLNFNRMAFCQGSSLVSGVMLDMREVDTLLPMSLDVLTT